MHSVFLINIFLATLNTVASVIFFIFFIEMKKISKENGYDLKLKNILKLRIVTIVVLVIGIIISWAMVIFKANFSQIIITNLIILPILMILGAQQLMFKFDDTTIKYLNEIYYLEDIEFSVYSKYLYNKIHITAKFKKDTKGNYNFKKNRVPKFYITLNQKEFIELSQYVDIRKRTNIKI